MDMIETGKKEYSYFDFLPVILASLYAGRAGGSFENWRIGFWIGAALVAVQMLVYRLKKRDMDPFATGMNVFLIVGAISFQFRIEFVLNIYDRMREATSFLFVGFVAIIFLILRNEGLLLQPNSYSKKFSIVLFCAIVIAGAMSFYFAGDQLLSITFPFMGLVFARNYLDKKAQELSAQN